MAKIKTSALISAIRNSLGNTTFTINRYGPVARTKVAPIQPRTSRQVTVRGAFTTQSKGWDSLTSTQQAAWSAFAAITPISDVFGDSRILAANAAYVRANANRAIVGLSAVTTPAATGGLFPVADTAAAAVGATSVITITTPAQTVSTGWYVVFATPGLNTGVYFAGSKQRIAGVAATTGAATTAVVTPTTYNPKLGSAAGKIVLVRVVRFDINGYPIGVSAYRVTAS